VSKLSRRIENLLVSGYEVKIALLNDLSFKVDAGRYSAASDSIEKAVEMVVWQIEHARRTA
jgi:hypothetical protein